MLLCLAGMCVSHGSNKAILSLRLPPSFDAGGTACMQFPPGARFSASQFWAGSPILPLAKGPERNATDFVASGEAAMLGWAPPPGSAMTTPLSDSHSLVRLLGGGPSAIGKDGDIVLRNKATHQLETQWDLLWSRLDPWVNNSVPTIIVVLDNVPYAFCAPGKCSGAATYGNDMGPANITEYGEWIKVILEAILQRYGSARANQLWFRVGTEPNTQPGHWNDTNLKYIQEYVAVAKAVTATIPKAKVGLANFGADGNAIGWDEHVFPMVQGIVDQEARVDFIALSCYGRGSPHCTKISPLNTQCRYSITTAATCAHRMKRLRALGASRWAKIPSQIMEYGLQENSLKLVDDDPGVFQAAWLLSTSVAHARTGIERGFHWHFGETSFSYDSSGGPCSKEAGISAPCSLYSGVSWVQAQAAHLFGSHPATILETISPGSNYSAGTSADGIGLYNPSTDEFGLLVTAFSPVHKTQDGTPVTIQIKFCVPENWINLFRSTDSNNTNYYPQVLNLEWKSTVLNRSTSTFDAIWREAKSNGWLTDPSDPNVYPLSKSRRDMLTPEGKKELIKQKGPAYLEMQRRTFAPSDWYHAGDVVTCGKSGQPLDSLEIGDNCTVTVVTAPPSVLAIWIRISNKSA